MTYSGAKSRSGPQMFLNKGQTEKIKQQLPVREACRVRPDKLYLFGRAQPCRLRRMTEGRAGE